MSPIFGFPRAAARHPDELAYHAARARHDAARAYTSKLYASPWRRFLFGPPTHNGRSARAAKLQNIRPDYHRAFEAENRARTAMVAARRKWLGGEPENN